MLEISWRGTQPVQMPDGSERKFILTVKPRACESLPVGTDVADRLWGGGRKGGGVRINQHFRPPSKNRFNI